MARRLTDEQWLKIKTRYELGDSNNGIANEFGIPESTIRAKAKTQNWQRKLRTQVIENKQNIKQIANNCEPSQIDQVAQRLKDEIDEEFMLVKSIKNLDKGALNIHNLVVADTFDKVKKGKISTSDASAILQKQGLGVDKIANRAGIGKADVEINNNQQNNTQINEFANDHMAAARAYQDFMDEE